MAFHSTSTQKGSQGIVPMLFNFLILQVHSGAFIPWAKPKPQTYLLEILSDSSLHTTRSSADTLLPSAPTPHPLGPIEDARLRSWISSEIISRFFKAVLYSPFAKNSFA